MLLNCRKIETYEKFFPNVKDFTKEILNGKIYYIITLEKKNDAVDSTEEAIITQTQK